MGQQSTSVKLNPVFRREWQYVSSLIRNSSNNASKDFGERSKRVSLGSILTPGGPIQILIDKAFAVVKIHDEIDQGTIRVI